MDILQRKYVETILQRFNMKNSKPVKVPIPVGVKLSAKQCPKTQEEEEDMSCVPYASAVYGKTREGALDNSEAGFQISIKEDLQVGMCFNVFGGAVSSMSKKQSVVALSTTDLEYMVATHASKEVVWLQRLCSSMGLVQGAIRIDYDNQSAIFLAKNPTYHSEKPLSVMHFVRDMIENKKVLLVKVDTLKNTTDALTKSMSSENFSWCREIIGIARLDK
eukprot:PITA_31322